MRWVEGYGIVSRNAKGEAVRLIGVNRDITARMQAEEALRTLNTELERRVEERTAEIKAINKELEAFTYTVSHDLRAPLRAMHGMSQALIEDYADVLPPEGVEFAQRIEAAAQRMDRLIQDLLAFSRVGRKDMRPRPVSLHEAVEAVLSTLSPMFEEVGADVAIEGTLPTVIAHPSTLDQVITNLVDNACKFVEKSTAPRVRLSAETRGSRVRLWVADNGIGIEPKHQERIFRIFERLHGIETYPGTGVGLALIKKAMQHMGGDVGVESEPGKGSRFWIDLPAVSDGE
ncbi:MAG: hypothetical protein D6781_00840 [Verrucomicrobia bacterium]|nr:MAG: hypothetical protein D6781_00840 [Verrucomicrobiota bacterium]